MEPNNLVRVPLSFFSRVQYQRFPLGRYWVTSRRPNWWILLPVLFCCVMIVPARAQQQQPPEDPEDEKQIELWLDQGMSAGLRLTNLWKSNSMNGSTKELQICTSTSFRVVLHSVCGHGLRYYRFIVISAILATPRSLTKIGCSSILR
jgi:hypothetical protein